MEVYIVYMELLSGHEKIITKSGISLNAGTLNQGFTVIFMGVFYVYLWGMLLVQRVREYSKTPI
jgi:hypothetical protein